MAMMGGFIIFVAIASPVAAQVMTVAYALSNFF
jgi:hypothetical protein